MKKPRDLASARKWLGEEVIIGGGCGERGVGDDNGGGGNFADVNYVTLRSCSERENTDWGRGEYRRGRGGVQEGKRRRVCLYYGCAFIAWWFW